MEIYKTVTPNCGRRRLLDVVVYKRFQLQSSDWEFFLMGCRLREVIAHGGSDLLSTRGQLKKTMLGIGIPKYLQTTNFQFMEGSAPISRKATEAIF